MKKRMRWQNLYVVGDRLLYNGIACVVSGEAYYDDSDSETAPDFTANMEVTYNTTDGRVVVQEVPFNSRHLVKRDFSGYILK